MTKEEIGAILKELRIARNMTQKQVAEAIGRKQQVVGHWETGYSQPDANTLFALCRLYDADMDKAFGFDRLEWYVSQKEKAVIAAYRDNPAMQPAVDRLLLIEERQKATPRVIESTPVTASEPVDKIVFDSPAAAGLPLYAESDYERLQFPADEVPDNADFGIRISGDSMEPTIADGSIVWVHKQPDIGDGEVGVFMLEDSAVCKRAKLRSNGRLLRLESDNPKYKPISGEDLQDARCVGKVLPAPLVRDDDGLDALRNRLEAAKEAQTRPSGKQRRA